MNTTQETAPDPGYYVPTPADCLEAGMIQPDERCIFFWVDHALPALQEGDPDIRVYLKYGDRITFYPIESNMSPVPFFECAADQSMNHELVFANRDACMAFLRNYTVAAEPAPERLTIKDVVSLGLKEHNGFCYEDGNDYTVRWDADGAYLSGPGHEDSAHRLDRDNASRVLRLRFPESIKDGLRESLPSAIEGILNATAAAEPASDPALDVTDVTTTPPDGYEVVPVLDADGNFVKHSVVSVFDHKLVGRLAISSSLEESNMSTEDFQRLWDQSAKHNGAGLTRTFMPKQNEGEEA